MKDLKYPKKSWERKTELEELGSLTSDYTTKLLAQNQNYRSMELDRKPRDKPTHLGHLIYDKGGNNIQWRKTVSSRSGAGKTRQLPVNG